MRAYLFMVVAGTVLVVTALTGVASGQSQEAAVVESATAVLTEFLSIPNESIPRVLLGRAQGLVIVPNVVKVGLVAGVRHGKGIAVVRDENGVWRPPTFVSLTGGSVGWQAGVQSTDVVLVFNTRSSVSGLMSGKFTLGVDAAVAAGPLGRQASAATDVRLQAEVFSYSRSRGLFAGASIDGSMVQSDLSANQQYYSAAGLRADGTAAVPGAQFPPSTTRLLATLAAYAPAPERPGTSGVAAGVGSPAGAPPPVAATTTAGVGQDAAVDTVSATRLELVQAAYDLGALLDESWRNYLSLPRGVFSGQAMPTVESLEQALRRYEAVTADRRYQVLLDRPEFQQLYGLLQTYTEQVRQLSQPAGAVPTADSGSSLRIR